ncbi:MAG: hypothetical protein ACREA0_28515 [bacterium]
MKKAAVIICSVFGMVGAAMACAGELPFPQTKDEIVDALSIKDGRTVE